MPVRQVAEAIRHAGLPAGISVRIVAVDGLGGSGKSTFAERLAAVLGDVPIVHTDDFASWDDSLGWWSRMIEQVFEPLTTTDVVCFQRYDCSSRSLGEWIEVPHSDCLIVEGVSASRVAFRPYLTYSIWVEASRDTRLRRGVDRHGEAMRSQWKAWMAAEDDYVQHEDPRSHADLIVSGEPDIPHDESTHVVVLET